MKISLTEVELHDLIVVLEASLNYLNYELSTACDPSTATALADKISRQERLYWRLRDMREEYQEA